MKKTIVVIMAVVLALAMVVSGVSVALADKPQDPDGNYKGNGAPSGWHYNLNILGKAQLMNMDEEDCGNGHRIFVPLYGKIRILLQEGDFAVLDCDGTDGQAKFRLPDPDPENDGITRYSVYIRLLGPPNQGNIKIEPGFIDDSGNPWVSTENILELSRGNPSHNNNKFQNVSKQLLYVYVDMDGDGTAERYPLFGEELYQYFWDYANNGVKTVQMRFYWIPTNTNL